MVNTEAEKKKIMLEKEAKKKKLMLEKESKEKKIQIEKEAEKKKITLEKEAEEERHPIFISKRTFGQRAADNISKWGGSWIFISLFLLVVLFWISLNAYILFNYGKKPFDPFPYILLNLALSLLAALQAPVILMSQNRQSERDRIRAEYDYSVNRKAEREIREIRKLIEKLHARKR